MNDSLIFSSGHQDYRYRADLMDRSGGSGHAHKHRIHPAAYFLSTISYIRQSQLVSTYGPGAMIDLSWFATVVSGLDFGKKGDLIAEPRLMQKIQQSEPPVN